MNPILWFFVEASIATSSRSLISQLSPNIREVPAESCVNALGYPCYFDQHFLAAKILPREKPCEYRAGKQARKGKTNINRNQDAKIVIGYWWHGGFSSWGAGLIIRLFPVPY